MKKQIVSLVLAIFTINLVLAVPVCIDNDEPSPIENLTISLEDNNIILNWSEAEDEPECSEISHYNIFRNNGYYDSTNLTSYVDEDLEDGEYEYVIYPVDLGGNEGIGISKTITLGAVSPEPSPPPSGRSGGGITTYWECGEWSECINKTQERVCEDIFGTKPNRTETKKCFPSFTPFEQGNETGNITDISQTTNFLTGAVTGIGNFAKSGAGALTLSVLVLVGAAVVIVLLRKRFSRKLSGETETEFKESGAESE